VGFRPRDCTVLFGGLDCSVSALPADMSATEAQVVCQHDQPVKCVKWTDHHGGLVVSGSWDGTVRLSDSRAPPQHNAAACTVRPGNKVLAMDVLGHLMVVATTDREVKTYDLRDLAGGKPRLLDSSSGSLEYQYRSVAVLPDLSGYAIGSVEGRTTIKFFQEVGNSKTFTFKCHRKKAANGSQDQEAYSVNSICFHPRGTFATAGADGSIAFWDYNAKQRLKEHAGLSDGIAAAAMSQSGDMLAYAVAYDWNMGPRQTGAGNAGGVFLHRCADSETAPKNR
jgi:mRNA export factor